MKEKKELLDKEFNKKMEEYNILLQNTLNDIENQKIIAIKKSQADTDIELAKIKNNLELERKKYESDTNKYNDELKQLITKLENEKKDKINAYTAEINLNIETLKKSYDEDVKRFTKNITQLKEEYDKLEKNI